MMKPMCNIHLALLGFGFKREKKSVTELSETSKSTLFLIASDFTNLLHNQRLKQYDYLTFGNSLKE